MGVGGLRSGVADQEPAFLEFELDRLTGGVLLFQLLGEIAEPVLPREHREKVAPEPGEWKATRPAVVAERPHRRLAPLRLVRGSPQQRRGEAIMTVGDQVGGDLDHVADEALSGEAPAID